MYDRLIAQGRVAIHDIYFDVGSDHIRAESLRALDAIATMLAAHADLRIAVEAHTDNAGAPEKNMMLSESRAAAVVNFLAMRGIDPTRLKAVGRGDQWPTAPNDTPLARQRNRRVELVLTDHDEKRPER